ncbi:MAG: hypothetical protein ACE5OS_14760 [Anaerolineae bacterium]
MPPYLADNLQRLQETFGDEPFTVQEAKKTLPVSRPFLFKILHELVQGGYLTRLGRGIYALDGSQSKLAVPLSETGRKIHRALYSEGIDFAITGLDVLLTLMRKRVRAAAGSTMRQVQAQAKQQATDDAPSLMATGLAVRPPDGLDEVKAAAQAAQTGRSEATGAQDALPAPAPAPPSASPPTVADTSSRMCPLRGTIGALSTSMRDALRGSNVVLYERGHHASPQPARPGPDTPPAAPDWRQLVEELVAAYAARLRNVLSRSGRKPFRLAGLHLYADLLTLLGSLETSLTYLPDEPRLTCFADAIRDALLEFESEYTWIAEGYTWVLDISAILDIPLPQPEAEKPDTPLSSTVHARLEAYLERLDQRTDLDAPLPAFRKHLRALTKRYAPGLFHCYDIPGLPRTNNDLESLFGRVRRQTLLTAGPYHAQQRLHEQGAWLLFEAVAHEPEQLRRLQRVSLKDWRAERQRMRTHRATFTDDRRFRRQSPKYLAELEARAAEIARLQLPS